MAIQKSDNIWHNGKLIPWDEATIHVMSHVVHYGSSVFEGIRCYAPPSGPAIFRAHEHIERLLNSAKVYRIEVDYTREQIDAAFCQGRNLLAKCLTGFLEGGFSQRLDSGSQWANRSRYPDIEALGGFAGKPRSGAVDVTHFVGDTVPRQAESVRTESVGFNDFGPSLEVVVVDTPNQIGLGKVQLVVTAIDENAVRVKQRSHGSVTQSGELLDPGKKVGSHIL